MRVELGLALPLPQLLLLPSEHRITAGVHLCGQWPPLPGAPGQDLADAWDLSKIRGNGAAGADAAGGAAAGASRGAGRIGITAHEASCAEAPAQVTATVLRARRPETDSGHRRPRSSA
eukprot:CAMPEP_0180786414 /NCGR_PEP_ID=MMETSP1038_2-20121128/50784_1 /TAXON_ID=632150 /ORGANISM="Azadinium spinosum, Strain 3D9" /LENGTH=117 /DNA_ID=CAMNT_0022823527 /DNA_START=257 /DNA_END=606 /DNA_ORIENTATION=+